MAVTSLESRTATNDGSQKIRRKLNAPVPYPPADNLRWEGSMRVLIADDDAAFALCPRRSLERWGYGPIVCDDGDDGEAPRTS